MIVSKPASASAATCNPCTTDHVQSKNKQQSRPIHIGNRQCVQTDAMFLSTCRLGNTTLQDELRQGVSACCFTICPILTFTGQDQPSAAAIFSVNMKNSQLLSLRSGEVLLLDSRVFFRQARTKFPEQLDSEIVDLVVSFPAFVGCPLIFGSPSANLPKAVCTWDFGCKWLVLVQCFTIPIDAHITELCTKRLFACDIGTVSLNKDSPMHSLKKI